MMKKISKLVLTLCIPFVLMACSTKSSTTTDKADALEDTTWTADIGEDYGAASQGDEDEVLTTLTLHFSGGSATNVVGDVSFDYTLNDDGTLDIKNLNVGETGINPDDFELKLEDDTLVLNARINGGNATVNFEKDS